MSEEPVLVIEERLAVIAGPPAKSERLAAVVEGRAAANAEPAGVSEQSGLIEERVVMIVARGVPPLAIELAVMLGAANARGAEVDSLGGETRALEVAA